VAVSAGGAWPVDSVDGLRPPSLTTGPSTAEGRSIFFMLDTIVPVSPGTNACPEKSGAAQNGHHPTSLCASILRSPKAATDHLHEADGGKNRPRNEDQVNAGSIKACYEDIRIADHAHLAPPEGCDGVAPCGKVVFGAHHPRPDAAQA
jgi:hypothetical protein